MCQILNRVFKKGSLKEYLPVLLILNVGLDLAPNILPSESEGWGLKCTLRIEHIMQIEIQTKNVNG